MGLGEAYKRWRHTRGYGVHSPYAYMIVKEILKTPKGAQYYGEGEIEQTIVKSSDRRWRKTAKFLLRLAARLDVGSTFIDAGLAKHKTLTTALRLANSRMSVTSEVQLIGNSRLLITNGETVSMEQLTDLLERPGRIILMLNAPAGWDKKLFEALDEGVMLHDKKSFLIISRPGMQKVSYGIRLRLGGER